MELKKPSRRQVLFGAGATVMAHSTGAFSEGMGAFLRIAPGDAGFAPDLEARLDKVIADGRIWNQHGLVVLRNDRLVLERYFEGEDQSRGVGEIGHVTFNADTIHDLRSCSKSLVGLLYGVELQQGKSAAAGSAALLRFSRIRRSGEQGWPRAAHHSACSDNVYGHRLG
jgi:hypothetical protein